MVGEWGRCASRVSSVGPPSVSIIRMAATASIAAWLEPTIRYLLCISVVLVQPDRLLRAAELRLTCERDGAREMLGGDVGASESADEADGGNLFAGEVERAQRLLIDRAGIPTEAHRAVDDADPIDLGKRGRHRFDREWTECLHLDQSDPLARLARGVDGILCGARHAADGDQRRVGVVEAILLDQRRMIAAEALAPGRMHLADDAERVLHAAALAPAVAHEIARAGTASATGERIDSHWPLRIERDMPVDVGRAQELVDRLLVGQLDAGNAEGEIIAVMADVNRQHDIAVLGDLVGHYRGVENLLHCLAVHLDPASLPHHHGVLLAAPNALRAQEIARDQRGNHRQAEARRAYIGLEH